MQQQLMLHLSVFVAGSVQMQKKKKKACYRYVLFYFCNFPVHVFKPSLLLQMYEFLERKKVSENAW